MGIGKPATLALFGLVCSADVSRAESLRIELTDSVELAPLSLDTARHEIEAIFAGGGLPISFPEAGAGCLARVYILEGIPGALHRNHQVFGRGEPMAVLLRDPRAEMTPVIYVSRSAVSAQATGAPGARLDPLVLGRALGRVMAHELAHVLLDFEHTPRGILKADFNQADLVGADIATVAFTPDQARKLALLARSDITKTARVAEQSPRN